MQSHKLCISVVKLTGLHKNLHVILACALHRLVALTGVSSAEQ
jgi:hypothetical protein